MKIDNFFVELKRRNVYKVAVAYVVASWALAQGLSQLLPIFEIPIWVVRLVVLFLIIGFPVAIVLSWAFEITPEGIKRAEEVDHSKSITKKTGRKLIAFTVVVAMIAVALFLFQLVRSKREPDSLVATISNKSIAILPFENLSRDPDNAYFTEGIQEEILTRLAKIADLKVISRTSTQRYKSAQPDLREIAKQLGVAHILEGSVQRAPDRVRVNVQLIKAETDAHLWAERFDRQLTDIFAIESEIAETVARTLQAKLSGPERRAIAARPTENTDAHQFYLKGRFFWNKRTANDLKKAVDYFNQAILADSNYAPAYAGLADSNVLLPVYAAGTPEEYYPKAKAAAEKALQLDDSLGEAHASLGATLCNHDFDFAQATDEFHRAIELNPNYATAHHWYGYIVLSRLPRLDEAIAEIKRALTLDPLSRIINADLGTAYYFARRYDEAIEQFRTTLEIDPGFYYTHWKFGRALAAKGALEAAIEEYQKARALNDDPQLLGPLGHAYGSSGNKSEALKILEKLKQLSKERYVSGYTFALVYLGLDDREEALRWLERSYEDRAGYEIGYMKVDHFLDPLRHDPRFAALAEKVVPAVAFK